MNNLNCRKTNPANELFLRDANPSSFSLFVQRFPWKWWHTLIQRPGLIWIWSTSWAEDGSHCSVVFFVDARCSFSSEFRLRYARKFDGYYVWLYPLASLINYLVTDRVWFRSEEIRSLFCRQYFAVWNGMSTCWTFLWALSSNILLI